MIDIKGYEGLYKITKAGEVFSVRANRFLKPWTTNLGYKRIQLSNKGQSKAIGVHRLVAIAYIPNPNNYPQVNHRDSNPSNNSWDNLEWCTASMNAIHAIAHGSHMAAKLRRLDQDTMRLIRSLRRNGWAGTAIAKKLGVGQTTVYHYLDGRSYKTFR